MIEIPPERLVHNKMFNALLPSICIYFHLVVKYLLHSIMSHILGLISKTLSSCTSHQLHWDVWVLSTAENQVSPPFWSHTNNTKEVAGRKGIFPFHLQYFLPCTYFWYPPEVPQNFWTWHKSIHVYEKNTESGHNHCWQAESINPCSQIHVYCLSSSRHTGAVQPWGSAWSVCIWGNANSRE